MEALDYLEVEGAQFSCGTEVENGITRLAMLLEKTLDTTVHGVVYEAVGTVDPAVLSAGAGVVAAACDRSLIPYVLLSADPREHEAWTAAAAGAVRRALLAHGSDAG